jgi:hypothetical protein
MIYLLLAFLGAVFPLSPAVYFLVTHPLDGLQFARDAIATPASLTAWLDVIISGLAVLVFVYLEGQRLGMRNRWIYGLATLTVGPSFGLPLFLYGRWKRLRSESVASPLAVGSQ